MKKTKSKTKKGLKVEQEDLEDEVGGLPDEEEAMVSVEVDADEPLDLTTVHQTMKFSKFLKQWERKTELW